MSLDIYIGPNGFGKTTKLKNIKKDLVDNQGVLESDILFLESEILLLDEMKDTKDDTKSMEYVLSELLSTPAVVNARTTYESAIDNEIIQNVSLVNQLVDDILSLNGSNRTVSGNKTAPQLKDFIEVRQDKEHKKLVKINSKDLVEGKMGSGQRMQLILSLVGQSTKTHIIIDEPEKYSHPSLLHRTAELVTILSRTKSVYIATHSPKLLSMIDFDLDHLFIINDPTHQVKSIDYTGICAYYAAHATIIQTQTQSFSYFTANGLKDNIKKLHFRQFLECLFSRVVYIVEGVNDYLFLNKILQDNHHFYDDYSILQTFGKHHMMLFAKIYDSLGAVVKIYHDQDNITNPVHVSSNTQLSAFTRYEFSPTIEGELRFTPPKSQTAAFISFITPNSYPTNYDI